MVTFVFVHVQKHIGLKKLLLLLLLCAPLIQFAQNSLGNEPPADLVFFEYFQKEQYHEVVRSLSRNQDLNANQQLLLFLSNQKIGNGQEAEIEEWIATHPDHPLNSLATFNYAQIQFAKGDTLTSKQSLAKIKPDELSQKDQATYGYLSGVISLKDQQYSRASRAFDLAAEKGYEDELELTYYQAFIAYHLSEYDKALVQFEKTKDRPPFDTSSKYYLARIYLESKEYEKVIELAQQELSEDVSLTSSGFYQLLGEAYAYQEDLEKASALSRSS